MNQFLARLLRVFKSLLLARPPSTVKAPGRCVGALMKMYIDN